MRALSCGHIEPCPRPSLRPGMSLLRNGESSVTYARHVMYAGVVTSSVSDDQGHLRSCHITRLVIYEIYDAGGGKSIRTSIA